MKNIMNKYLQLKGLFILFLVVCSFQAKAQGISVGAQLDSTLMFIGGQIDLKLQVSQPEGIQVNFPMMVDTVVTDLEILYQSEIDTLSNENQQLLLEKTYRITAFDSGLYYIPPIEFEIAQGEMIQIAKAQPMSLNVVNPFEEVDPEKGVMDIKQPINTPFVFAEIVKYIYYFIGISFLIAVIALLFMFLSKKKTPLEILTRPKPKLPPHVIALQKLDDIKDEKLWQRGLVKEYYSGVTEALRVYIEDRYNISAMEQTTEEIIQSFKYIQLGDDSGLGKLHQVLSTADFVKFAKVEPSYEENEVSLTNAFDFVNKTKIVAEVVEGNVGKASEPVAKEAVASVPSKND